MRYLILAIGLVSCEVSEIPKPVSVKKLTKVYTIQPQIGSVFNPVYLPNLGNGIHN